MSPAGTLWFFLPELAMRRAGALSSTGPFPAPAVYRVRDLGAVAPGPGTARPGSLGHAARCRRRTRGGEAGY